MTQVRVCIDVRKLNQYLVNDDKFQLPHIPHMLSQLAGNRMFGEVDIGDAYLQMKLDVDSQPYTAFTWEGQQYMFTGVPFGIKHIPSLFQRYMSTLFHDMPFVVVYIDNICFGSKNWKQHEQHAAMVIERLNSVNLRIKPTSINFGCYQIKLLGHIVTPYGIGIDPEKKQMILDWLYPMTGAAMQSFLGLGTYLRDHIRHYADITAPFEKIKGRKTIEWTNALKAQFDVIKRAFASAPFLTFPDPAKRFAIACDASQSGIGGVLYQPDDDNDTVTATNIVAVYSRQLKQHEYRYPVYKKELLGLVMCLRKFHTYIACCSGVTVLTDHKPLIHIVNQRQLSVALQQWLDILLNYDIIIKYRPGVLHVVPDALSRMYMSAYDRNDTAWGVVDSVRILDAFDAHHSPSDVLCAESLAAIVVHGASRDR